MHNHDPTIVAGMLRFLYKGSYDPPTDDLGAQMVFHVKMYVDADMLNIKELKTFAVKKTIWGVHPVFLNNTIPLSISDFCEAVNSVFTYTASTDTGMRTSMIRFCTKHQKKLLADSQFVEVMNQRGELGVGMLRLSGEQKAKEMMEMRSRAKQLKMIQTRRSKEKKQIVRLELRLRGLVGKFRRFSLLSNRRGQSTQARTRAVARDSESEDSESEDSDSEDSESEEIRGALWRTAKDLERIRENTEEDAVGIL